MSNIFKTPRKKALSKLLTAETFRFLKENGWAIEKPKGYGRRLIYKITKGEETFLVSLKKTQNTWFAFVPKGNAPRSIEYWDTLRDVDVVLVASVDSAENPENIRIHWLKSEDVEACLSISIGKIIEDGRSVNHHHGHWISLYDSPEEVIGAGLGREHVPVYETAIPGDVLSGHASADTDVMLEQTDLSGNNNDVFMDAKNMVASAFNVDIENVTIVISV